MDVDYEKLITPVTLEKNAELCEEIAGAPIVNLDAAFLIPEEAVGVDMSFFRIEQLHKRIEEAIKQGALINAPSGEALKFRPFRRPDFKASPIYS
jgi:hypothetical protein